MNQCWLKNHLVSDNDMLRIHVKVPASLANLGPGYDCLALAVDMYNEYFLEINKKEIVTDGDPFDVIITGYGDAEFTNSIRNFFIQSFLSSYSKIRRTQTNNRGIEYRFKTKVYQINNIPDKRGLGSSSSASIAGVLAAEAFFRSEGMPDNLSNSTILKYSLTSGETCPDNVVAALMGGLTNAFWVEENTDTIFIPSKTTVTNKELRIVVLIPEFTVSTPEARSALPPDNDTNYKTKQVVKQANSLAAVMKLINDNEHIEYLGKAMANDMLHHSYRAKLHDQKVRDHLKNDLDNYPDIDRTQIHYNVDKIIACGVSNGAFAGCIGGSGSTLAFFTSQDNVDRVKKAITACFGKQTHNFIQHEVYCLYPNNNGAMSYVFNLKRGLQVIR